MFYGCTNLKTILLNGNKLKTIGSGASSKISSKAVIKIKTSSVMEYNTLVKKLKKQELPKRNLKG